jgi:hypothetical protein
MVRNGKFFSILGQSGEGGGRGSAAHMGPTKWSPCTRAKLRGMGRKGTDIGFQWPLLGELKSLPWLKEVMWPRLPHREK